MSPKIDLSDPALNKVRGKALEILEEYQKTFRNPDVWRIVIDELYIINLYSVRPFNEEDLRKMLECCNQSYTFSVIETSFMKYIVRARFYLKL